MRAAFDPVTPRLQIVQVVIIIVAGGRHMLMCRVLRVIAADIIALAAFIICRIGDVVIDCGVAVVIVVVVVVAVEVVGVGDGYVVVDSPRCM